MVENVKRGEIIVLKEKVVNNMGSFYVKGMIK